MTLPPPNPYADAAQSTPTESSKKTVWIWVTAAAVALLFTGIVIGAVISQLGSDGGSDGATGDSTTEVEEPAAPESQLSGEFAWPENLATGGVIFTGSGAEPGIDIVRSDAPDADTAPESREAAELGEQAIIHLYLDYRCPYCAMFEKANQQTLTAVVETGSAALEVHPLTFLDRVDETDYYSSRTAGALACVASEQPEGAWAAHTALANPAFQPAEDAPGHDNATIISTIDAATGGLSDGARACITEERFVSFAQTLNQWWFSNPVPGNSELTVQGTPFAVVNGVPYAGDPRDGEAFAEFLEQQGITVP